jgi:hypothetical protein
MMKAGCISCVLLSLRAIDGLDGHFHPKRPPAFKDRDESLMPHLRFNAIEFTHSHTDWYLCTQRKSNHIQGKTCHGLSCLRFYHPPVVPPTAPETSPGNRLLLDEGAVIALLLQQTVLVLKV